MLISMKTLAKSLSGFLRSAIFGSLHKSSVMNIWVGAIPKKTAGGTNTGNMVLIDTFVIRPHELMKQIAIFRS